MKSLEITPHGLAIFHANYQKLQKKSNSLLFTDFVPVKQADSTYDKADFYKAIGCGDYQTVEQMLNQNFIYIICNYRQVSLRHHVNYIISSVETMAFFISQHTIPDSTIRCILQRFLRILNSDKITERSANMIHYIAIHHFTCIANLAYKSAGLSDKVKLCINYVHKNNFEKISLSAIADDLEVNERQLSQLFQTELGMSLQNFAHFLRIEFSKPLLALTNLSSSEITELLNYSSESYFKKVFKQHTKLSTKEFLLEFEKEQKALQE